MAYATSHTLSGLVRTDGTTPRTLTFLRVNNVPNGFVLREQAAVLALAATITYRATEIRTNAGLLIRHSQVTFEWPYELTPGSGIIAGKVVYNKNGLHIPVDVPPNTRKDIWTQLKNLADGISTGTVGKLLWRDPIHGEDFPF